MEALDIPSVIILQYNGHKIAVPRPGATSKYRDLQVKSRAYFSIPDASRIRFFTTELATAEGEEVEISKDAWKDIVSKARRLHVKAVPREPATVVSRQASASTVHSTKDESDAPMPTRKGPRLTTLGVVPYTTFQIFVKTLSGKTITVNLHPAATVWGLKNILVEHEELRCPEQLTLLFNGKSLENSELLKSCGVEKDSTLHMVMSLSTWNLPL